MNAVLERIANFLDEIILLPFDYFLSELAKTYPETSNFVYRYGKSSTRRVGLCFETLESEKNLIKILKKLDSLLFEENYHEEYANH